MPVMTHDMSATLIRGARVLTLDSQNTEFSSADILLSNGVIAAVGPSLSAPEGCKVIEAAGMLAMPGLINAHFHSPGNLMRGQLDCLPLEIFMLREVPPLANEANSERLIKIRTLLGAAEMLRGGITCVMDDAYHVPIASIAAIDSICNAYSEIGIRARVAIDQAWAVLLGAIFIIGRALYFKGYVEAANKRSLGFGLSFFPTLFLLFGGIYGAARSLLG